MSDQPNVLFLLSDEHSFRFFGHLDPAAEGEPCQTPSFDALAQNGAVFDQNYCQMPLCTPSRLCLLTGRNVRGCGAWTNGSYLDPQIPTMADAFNQAGYETCLMGKMHLGGDAQFAGFQHRPYGDLTGQHGHQPDPITKQGAGMAMRSRTADAGQTSIPESQLQEQIVARETVSFLREHEARKPDTPWMLCASFSRPHFPLTAPKRHLDRYWPDRAPEPKVGREGDTANHPCTQGMVDGFKINDIETGEAQKARAGYFACVDYLDEIVGDLLHTLERDGLLENTIVVYSSDHGEYAGEHGLWWKHGWHEAATRVPLFIQLPEHRDGTLQPKRFNTPTSLADLVPTLCGLTGASKPDGLDGWDLSEAIHTGNEPERGPVFVDNLWERWGEGSRFRVIREGRYKYVGFSGMQPELLFDLEDDPLEQRNLVERDPAGHAATLERFRALLAETMDFDAAEAEREAGMQKAGERRMNVEGAGNIYHMPDGRLVNAERTLYDPHVIAERPAELYADWPT